ncbi:MAG: response regulator [Armatimonadota bacterium]
MQSLHLFFDISAVAAALGAGAVLVQTRGRLRSAEAKRNALQSRLSELEQKRAMGVAEADAAAEAVQATTEKLLVAAKHRVTELEDALQNAEKQQSLGAQRVEALEKNLLKEQAKIKSLQSDNQAIPPPPVEIPEAPSIRMPVRGAKKTPVTILMGANWDSKSPVESEKHLIEADYTVVRAASVEKVLAAARDSRPNLVVLDTQISGTDSLSVLEKFKADPELREIPVVIVCALKEREKATELGAAGCVVPPITSNVLLSTVKTAFINHRKRMERSRLAKTANTSGERSAVLSAAE